MIEKTTCMTNWSRRAWRSYSTFRRYVIWFIRDLHLTWNGKDTCWTIQIITDHRIMEEFNFWRWSNSLFSYWHDYFEQSTRGIWLYSRFSVMSDRGILLCLFFLHKALDEVREESRMRDLHCSSRDPRELDFQRRLVDERSDFDSSIFWIGPLFKLLVMMRGNMWFLTIVSDVVLFRENLIQTTHWIFNLSNSLTHSTTSILFMKVRVYFVYLRSYEVHCRNWNDINLRIIRALKNILGVSYSD